MFFSNEEIKKYIHGACEFCETDDGYLTFYRFTKSQREAIAARDEVFGIRSHQSSGITFRINTDATYLSFDYKYLNKTSQDSIDIYVYGSLDGIVKIADGNGGHYECVLHRKPDRPVRTVEIYMSCEHQIAIKNISMDGEVFLPCDYNEKVLWLGDSITQGFGPLMSSMSYVNQINRILQREILVQGISGIDFDTSLLAPIPGFTPDKIVVALGTNGTDDPEYANKADFFYKKLNSLYPDVPCISVTPLWKRIYDGKKEFFDKKWESIYKNCEKYGIKTVNGFDLIPHSEIYFRDGLHPNIIGCSVYAVNLAYELEKMNF